MFLNNWMNTQVYINNRHFRLMTAVCYLSAKTDRSFSEFRAIRRNKYVVNHSQDSFLSLTDASVGIQTNEAQLISWGAPSRIVYLNLPHIVQQPCHNLYTIAELLHIP
jgi:hypothetical protein